MNLFLWKIVCKVFLGNKFLLNMATLKPLFKPPTNLTINTLVKKIKFLKVRIEI